MTKQEILEYFKDINHAYNESTRLDDLSHMLDELMQSNSDGDCISRQAVLDKIKEICFSKEQKWVDFRVSQGSNGQRNLIINFIEDLPSIQPKPSISENPKLTLGECIIMAMSKITADLSEAAEKNWTEPQCEMLTRLICSVFMDKPYDEVTEEDMKSILEEQDE